MSNQSRREFLKVSAALAGSMALGKAFAQETAPAPAAPSPLQMAIARWQSANPATADEIAGKLTAQAIEALGGMQRFVKRGDVVWVKPNIGWDRAPELAANTNPEVVRTIIRMCLEAGAKAVKVGDYPCAEPARAYMNSGIQAAAEAAGAQMVFLDTSRFKDMAIGGERLKTTPVYPEIVECDLVIDVPIAKDHGSTGVSLCMKNYMGVVGNRRIFHQDLPGCIRDITAFMKPRISILDAVRVLTAHGPTGGDLADVKQLNVVAAATDIVALDAFGAELLGRDPLQVGTIVEGHKAGLGEIDYHKLALKEIVAA